MKFDFCIGNPPYQEESAGEKLSDPSIYHHFMDAAYEVADKVELITPARFLFDNGNTPTAWNQKMLNDEHFKVLEYEPDAKQVFNNVGFMGGVAIHYRDNNQSFEPIECFTCFDQLNTILKKVKEKKEESLMTIIFNQNRFNLDVLLTDYPNLKKQISSNGRERRLTSSCIGFDCFHETKGESDIEILGYDRARVTKYVNSKYIDYKETNLTKYKVVIPANNGSPAIGEAESTQLIGTPIIAKPSTGFTQTFISIGCCDTEKEAQNIMKYVTSKFARIMLGILKVTQNGKKPMWKHVPLQNFTNNSDINWNTTVENIDKQLYKKYGLSDEEITFIETNVKEMK